jgi:hypothetical protein
MLYRNDHDLKMSTNTTNFMYTNFSSLGEIWKELDLTKRKQPTAIFSDHPFRSYSSLKMPSLKRNVKTAGFFVTYDLRISIS